MRETFQEWMREVDKELRKREDGLTHEFLPDFPYPEWYREKMNPKEAARRAISLCK